MHSFLPTILADSSSTSSGGAFILAAITAAILWFLIWRLLRGAVSDAESLPIIFPTPEEEDDIQIPAPEPTATPEPEPEPDLEETGLPPLETSTPEQASAQFRQEIDNGAARLDDAYGVVYITAPERADDLKKIKGVAKVLEGKLNEHGVYTYRQIAFWTAPAVREFSKLLTNFKDRIHRDNWIAQARQLHEEKYGEKL